MKHYPCLTIAMDYLECQILILGCGNYLFGDDGFGGAVADALLDSCHLPPQMGVINAGISVRDILFTIALSEQRPRAIIVVDAVDAGQPPGTVLELEIDQLPEVKIDDFSMHQMPTSNLLRDLNDLCDVDVRILAVQIQEIPDLVSPGLTDVVEAAIPDACNKIIAMVHKQLAPVDTMKK